MRGHTLRTWRVGAAAPLLLSLLGGARPIGQAPRGRPHHAHGRVALDARAHRLCLGVRLLLWLLLLLRLLLTVGGARVAMPRLAGHRCWWGHVP